MVCTVMKYLNYPQTGNFFLQLRENYRSSSNIVKAASVVLKFSGYDRRIGSLQALSLVPTVKVASMTISLSKVNLFGYCTFSQLVVFFRN